MPIELRIQHPDWICIEIDQTTIVLNNTIAITKGTDTINYLRVATDEELENSENITYIYMPYISDWLGYVVT